MSDLTTIIARIDTLQAAVQTMTNALAAKADKTNKTLDPANKDGLQAAVQAMANSLAGKADQSNWRLEQIKPDIDTIGCKVMVILQAVGVQMDPETGLYPCGDGGGPFNYVGPHGRASTPDDPTAEV